MLSESFKEGDQVMMYPKDTGWRGVIIAKHRHRNNGYKVRTTRAHNDLCSEEFWVRPVSIQKINT